MLRYQKATGMTLCFFFSDTHQNIAGSDNIGRCRIGDQGGFWFIVLVFRIAFNRHNADIETFAEIQFHQAAADKAGVPFTTNQVGGMFGLFFTEQRQVNSYQQATMCNIESFKRFFHLMLAEGVYLAPSAYEAGFLSLAHSEQDLAATIAAAERAFAELAK